MRHVAFAVLTAIVLGLAAPKPARAGPPRDVVYLADIDPTIRQEMRYFGSDNFLGRPVKGYEAPECILTRRTAEALKGAQARLASRKLSLIVYDCYRPVRAARDFAAWARDPADTKMKREFYPELDKSRLFALGYVARRSTHSLGHAVDLAIVASDAPSRARDPARTPMPCHLPAGQRSPENNIDFGTGYDCFHPLSRTRTPKVSGMAKANRELLVREMSAAGFVNYAKEWWHFLLPGAAAPAPMDFPVAARPTGNKKRPRRRFLNRGSPPSRPRSRRDSPRRAYRRRT